MEDYGKQEQLETDSFLVFSTEEEPTASEANPVKSEKWKILIVDDDEEIHNVTQLALSDVHFKGSPISLYHAYSEKQAREIICQHSDFSLILLDIVMEEDDSGLKLIQFIREQLKNNFVRIVIRTGQPGQAPERKVIVDYDINDYKEKGELTSQKLFSSIITSLRSYDNLMAIEHNRRALEKIIEEANDFFIYRKVGDFYSNILKHIFYICTLDDTDTNENNKGLLAIKKSDESYVIIHAYGSMKDSIARNVADVLPKTSLRIFKDLEKNKQLVYFGNCCLYHYFKSKTDLEYLIYIHFYKNFSVNQMSLLKLLFTAISSAFDNICLSNDIINTQTELLITLGEVVETRSKETGFHVRRVAEYSKLLALKYGLREEEAELIKQASPMHDIGKVGIFDEILIKPGPLTKAEFEIMKTHTVIGYEIFKNSKRKILKAASLIAYQHHEKYDGTGYPLGLKGEEIHIYSRIMSIADIFDAVVSDRVYKKGWPVKDVLRYIKSERGKTFDPKLVDIFFQNIDEILKIRDRFKDS